jgi:Arc/MetJ family transcription regulator
MCMSRTNIDLDDEACEEVMRRYELTSKRDAVNLALRTLAGEVLDSASAHALRGSGWDADLNDLRAARS